MDSDIISNTTKVKLLGITLDKRFTFNKHVKIYKANQNIKQIKIYEYTTI